MNVVDKAIQTQLQNIQKRSGKTLEELFALVRTSGLTKHGEIRSLLKDDLKLGHGDANLIAQMFLGSPSSGAPAASLVTADALDSIYEGPKASLRPIHETLMAAIESFGPFEIAPKKANVSLRRKKQFAMIGPTTKTRVEVGLNMKGIDATDRLIAAKPGGMCQYTVNLTDPGQVDGELLGWIRTAYDSAG